MGSADIRDLISLGFGCKLMSELESSQHGTREHFGPKRTLETKLQCSTDRCEIPIMAVQRQPQAVDASKQPDIANPDSAPDPAVDLNREFGPVDYKRTGDMFMWPMATLPSL